MSFVTDLRIGEESQHKVVEILNTYFPQWQWEINTEKRWVDIVSPFGLSVECKYDRRAPLTWNVFIEVACNKSPSWIYKYDGVNVLSYSYEWTTILINMRVLKSFIEENSSILKKIKCWDGWRSEGYLISIEEIKKLPLTKIIAYGNQN